jgi:hypothetical protein
VESIFHLLPLLIYRAIPAIQIIAECFPVGLGSARLGCEDVDESLAFSGSSVGVQ